MPNNNQLEKNAILKEKENKWERIETLLSQNEDEIQDRFCLQLINESDEAYDKRKEEYVQSFINMSQDLVSAPVNSVFRQGKKEEYEKDSMLEEFSKNVTLGNEPMPFDRYLKDFIGIGLRAYGNVFTVIDKPRGIPKNRLDERNAGMPYLSNIRPLDVLDWQVVDGEFIWFAYQRDYTPIWYNPFEDNKPLTETVQCLWTQKDFIVEKKMVR